ncbi:MAG: hypothetical protein IPJ69_04240 [Deltaproteobacteria bacterium]|nr:MAG: hypothetical protein IPJ69_04240 [Deltaproteobacteria bacterium]
MTLVTFFLVLIFAITLYLLVSPLVLDDTVSAPHISNGVEDLNCRKKEILESLKEFELDRNMEKISHEDYQSLYQETFVEGTRLLKELEQKEQRPVVAPKVVRDTTQVIVPAQSAGTPKFCSQCGQALEPQGKFCSQCGHKIQRAL